MTGKHRWMLFIALAIVFGCKKEPEGGGITTPPEEADLVAETGGKSDTGYMSDLAEELEGEFRGELRIDVTDKSEAEKQALLSEYGSSSFQFKNLVLSQVKFAKKKVKSEQLHMNLYSDVIEAETVELIDGNNTLRATYKVRLESIVSYEELEKAGVELNSLLGNTIRVKIPADPRNVFTRVGERCAEGFDAGSLADYNYFYYFDPDKPGCDLHMTEATFTVSSLAPPPTTYPEYDRLGADNKVTVMVIFGAAGHEEELSSWDWGVREWREFKFFMQDRGFRKVADLTPKGERFRRIRAGVEEIIDIISPYDIHRNPESDSIFKRGLAEYEIILYNGHSFYGSLSVLRDCSVYPPETYQIIFMGSCWSYEYYTNQIFECKKTAADPRGWDLADVVNDTEAGWFHNSAEFSRILLTNLLSGVETKGKDGDRYYTWYNIISAMNKYALEAQRRYLTETHEIMGVSGVKNNKYDPEVAGATSPGKRYEAPAAYDIPDNTPEGIDSEIVVVDSIFPSRITVAVNITHPYIEDLKVSVIRNEVEVVLHDRVGSWEDDIIREYEVGELQASLLGLDAQGSWILRVSDNAQDDVGRINSWSLTLVP